MDANAPSNHNMSIAAIRIHTNLAAVVMRIRYATTTARGKPGVRGHQSLWGSSVRQARTS